jgi:mRNA interferase RelE/StbE
VEIRFTKNFSKESKKCPRNIQEDIKNLISLIKNTEELLSIHNLEKLKGYDSYFRYRTGSWRVGIEQENSVVKLAIIVTIATRGDI